MAEFLSAYGGLEFFWILNFILEDSMEDATGVINSILKFF